MTDRNDEQKNQTQVGPRANLIYLLERLSGLGQANDRESSEETQISREQVQMYQKQNGIA